MDFFKNHLRTIVIIALIALLSFWGLRSFRPKSNSQAVYNPQKDQLVTPTRQDLKDTLTLAGSIDASNKALLTFPTSGKMNWVGVKVGDYVQKNQAIASLDKSDLQKQYQQLMNDYLTNRWTFEDTQSKYQDEKDKYLVTDEIKRVLEKAQFSLNNSVLNVELKNIAIRNATLLSPISGVVTAINQPVAGVNVTPVNASFTVIDPQSLFFKAKIDQEDVPKITQGQITDLSLDAFPDQPISSSVSYIAFTPIEGEISTVYEIRFYLPSTDTRYRIGMDGDANIVLSESTNTLTVPSEAVIQENDQSYLLLKNPDNQLTKTSVEIGIETDTVTEIKSGLLDNDQVVIKTD
jgi:RND family efflux transporter MFP subunit